MTIAFPDVANYQAGLIIQPGTVAVAAKSTEGTYYTDASYATFKAQAAGVGALFWAYHFLIQGNGAAQADYCFRVVGPGVPVMLDVEPIPAQKSYPTISDCLAFITRYRQLGGRVCLAYLPRWYWTQIGQPDLKALGVPIVASGYPGGYSDSDPNWNAYGGVNPVIWQYTNKQPYGGMQVDFNAFRGTVQQLAALVLGDTDTMTPYDVWAFQNATYDKIDMRQRLVNAESAATQALAGINALAAKLSAPPAIDTHALASELAADLAPLMTAGATAEQIADAVVAKVAAKFQQA